MSQSIIDRDIEFYRGEILRLESEYRRATVNDEYSLHVQILIIKAIIASLVVYREYLNGKSV